MDKAGSWGRQAPDLPGAYSRRSRGQKSIVTRRQVTIILKGLKGHAGVISFSLLWISNIMNIEAGSWGRQAPDPPGAYSRRLWEQKSIVTRRQQATILKSIYRDACKGMLD